jgi:hypothetical protein
MNYEFEMIWKIEILLHPLARNKTWRGKPRHKHNETQKKNQVVQNAYYIIGRVEDTQE